MPAGHTGAPAGPLGSGAFGIPELGQELAGDDTSGTACPSDFDDAGGQRRYLLLQQSMLITW